MSPDKRRRRTSRAPQPAAALGPGPDDPYEVVYFRRHPDDDPGESAPGRTFLAETCPAKVRVSMQAVLIQVAASPPHRFSGGGKWEAMHGDMTGYHEVRVDGPGRHHYRLFCLLDRAGLDASGAPMGPLLVVLAGADKPFRTELSAKVYAQVRALGEEYRGRNPRSIC